jgi:YD repeat-containing protein
MRIACLLMIVTLGTEELVLVPEEIIFTAVRRIDGEKIRFTYDRFGRLIEVEHISRSGFFKSLDNKYSITPEVPEAAGGQAGGGPK